MKKINYIDRRKNLNKTHILPIFIFHKHCDKAFQISTPVIFYEQKKFKKSYFFQFGTYFLKKMLPQVC